MRSMYVQGAYWAGGNSLTSEPERLAVALPFDVDCSLRPLDETSWTR